MLDPQKCAELIRQHFAEITTEQFLENLKKSSPELFEDEALPDSAESLLSSETASKYPLSEQDERANFLVTYNQS